MNRGSTPPRSRLLFVIIALVTLPWVHACNGDSAGTPDDGDGSDLVDSDQVGFDTLDVAAPPFAGSCPPDFGEKTPGSLAMLVGQVVVLEGRVIVGQPVKVAPQECVGLGGLSAIHLRTKAGGTWQDDVQLLTADLDGIFCGCPLAQDDECLAYPPGAKMRLEGTLEDNPSIAPGVDCYQKSCFAIVPQESCFVDGCDHDDHCPDGSCNTEAYQCRAQAGDTCDEEVGCDPEDGAAHFCVDTTPSDPLTSETQCSPVGDGSEDSVCAVDEDCAECPECECIQHLCTYLLPIG